MEPRTHRDIDSRWSGRPELLEPGRARVILDTIPAHGVDAEGLVHGGFVFALADHAAMLAVNEPTVVLAGAEVEFLGPSRVGDVLVADAEVRKEEGKRRLVAVEVRERSADTPSFRGTFRCAVPSRHVLAARAADGGER